MARTWRNLWRDRKPEMAVITAVILLTVAIVFGIRTKSNLPAEKPSKTLGEKKTPTIQKPSSESTEVDPYYKEAGVAIDERFEMEEPMVKEMPEVLETLKRMAEKSPLAKEIYDHHEDYPEALLKLAANRVDSHSFVRHFNSRRGTTAPSLEESYPLERKFPLYIQWDPRWGYKEYPEDLFCTIACGPTTLAMLLNGYGFETTPLDLMEEMRSNHRYVINFGTNWQGFTDTLKEKGFEVLPLAMVERKFLDHLKKGEPIVINVGPSIFTNGGHYLLLVGTDENGAIYMNDSHSIRHSKKPWTFEEIKPYIRAAWTIHQP
ncbi:MAG: C39 family peptidase [Tissierellia bacterium]|nr:C39 family peptidase [Tissierellia bacterium]